MTAEPVEPDPQRFVPELEEAAGDDLAVIFRPACRSRAELEEVRIVLRARDWHPNAMSIDWSALIDASNSRVVVSLPADAREEALTLHE
ncbi:MAG: hypothetical protein ACRDVM_06330, partial [Acidimicrobiia bacterium]